MSETELPTPSLVDGDGNPIHTAPAQDTPPAPVIEPDPEPEAVQDTPHVDFRAAVRSRLDGIRAMLTHGENGDHRALAGAVRKVVDLLDESLGS